MQNFYFKGTEVNLTSLKYTAMIFSTSAFARLKLGAHHPCLMFLQNLHLPYQGKLHSVFCDNYIFLLVISFFNSTYNFLKKPQYKQESLFLGILVLCKQECKSEITFSIQLSSPS